MIKRIEVVGVMGLPCTGKTTFINMMITQLKHYRLKINKYKMSDFIYKKLKCLEIESTKENMIWLSNILTSRFGKDYWTNVVYKDIVSLEKEYDVIFIETGYMFKELMRLKQKIKNMIIVGIIVDEVLLKERVLEKESDPQKTLEIIDKFKDKFYILVNDANYIINNSANVGQLSNEIKIFLKKYLLRGI